MLHNYQIDLQTFLFFKQVGIIFPFEEATRK